MNCALESRVSINPAICSFGTVISDHGSIWVWQSSLLYPVVVLQTPEIMGPIHFHTSRTTQLVWVKKLMVRFISGFMLGFPQKGVPKNGLFMMEIPVKIDVFFGVTPILGNLHVYHVFPSWMAWYCARTPLWITSKPWSSWVMNS